MSYCIGLDLGGTSIKAGVISMDGKVVSRIQTMIGNHPEERSGERVGRLLYECAQRVASVVNLDLSSDIRSIGIGSPGIIDSINGIVIGSANFKDWKNVPIGPMVSKASGLPVFLENDANCALLAEAWVGAARKKNNVLMLTIGTGIGSGILANGQLVRGAEVGHTILIPDGRQCGCGQLGCFERYTSGSAIALSASECKALAQSSDANNPYTAKAIFDLSSQGNTAATAILHKWADHMAIGLINFSRTLDPEVIIIGGGVAQADGMLAMIDERITARSWRFDFGRPPIVLPRVRNDAGLIGAAYVGKVGLVKAHI